MKTRTQYRPVLLLWACMAAVLLVFLLGQMSQPPSELLYIQDTVTGKQIELYYDEVGDTYYLFLPGYAGPETMKLGLRAPARVAFTDSQGEEHSFLEIPRDVGKLTMTVSTLFYRETVDLELHYTDGLPSLYIEGDADLLEQVHASKLNERTVTAAMADAQGGLLFTRAATMAGRGNGSWNNQDKRPYNLDLEGAVNIGPFQDLEKLCLLAEYSDESKLRNSLGFYAGQALDIPYSSGYLYTNLYINGEYKGLYGMVTKQEYKKHLKEDGIQAVFELTSNQDDVDFVTAQFHERSFSILYGDFDYVWEKVNKLDRAMMERDWDDCFQRIDLESFALKYALDEFLGNMDLAHASQYYYIKDDVIHCMLPWDYDWTIGNSIFFYDSRPAWVIKAYVHPTYWATIMIENGDFRQAVAQALETRFTDDFLQELSAYLASAAAKIEGSRTADGIRWEHARPYDGLGVTSGMETVEEFVQMFTSYFPQRRAFLLDYFSRIEDYCRVEFEYGYFGGFCIPRDTALAPYLEGATVLEQDAENPKLLGWFAENGKQPHEIETVTENMNFIRRYAE